MLSEPLFRRILLLIVVMALSTVGLAVMLLNCALCKP